MSGARVGVLLSGRGSNFRALHDAMARGEVPATIALVVSNRADAPGLAAARELGLETALLPHQGEPSREAHDRKIVEALRGKGVEWVCLAGYMRLLSSELIRAFPQRILNIHPSLLPAFPGSTSQRRRLEYGVARSRMYGPLCRRRSCDHGPIRGCSARVAVRGRRFDRTLFRRVRIPWSRTSGLPGRPGAAL
jgi:phosphoribosylglycinamide formyltransferase-1